MQRALRGPWLIFTVGALIAVTAAASLATVTLISAGSASPGTIRACVRTIAGPGGNPPKGQLRIIGPTENCTPNLETLLTWSQGTGLTGREVVTTDSTLVTSSTSTFASCPMGKVVIGGGVSVITTGPSIVSSVPSIAIVTENGPNTTGDAWRGTVTAIDAGNVTPIGARVTAICAFSTG